MALKDNMDLIWTVSAQLTSAIIKADPSLATPEKAAETLKMVQQLVRTQIGPLGLPQKE